LNLVKTNSEEESFGEKMKIARIRITVIPIWKIPEKSVALAYSSMLLRF